MSTNSDATPPYKLSQRALELKRLLALVGSKSCKASDLEAFTKHVFHGVPVSVIPEVVAIYCKHLEANTPKPGHFRARSANGKQAIAYFALTGLGNLADMTIDYPTQFQEGLKVIRKNWSNIYKWVQYAWSEVAGPGPATVRIQVFQTLSYDKDFFEWSINNEDGFLESITKLWWESDKLMHPLPFVAFRAFQLFQRGMGCTLRQTQQSSISDLGPNSGESVDVHATVTRAVGGDIDGLAKRVLAHLAPPLCSQDKKYNIAIAAFSTIDLLATDVNGFAEQSNQITKFENVFCRNRLGPIVMQHLELVLADFESENPLLNDAERYIAVDRCLKFMFLATDTTGALHWTSVLLQNGVLRCIANLVRCTCLLGDNIRGLLSKVFSDTLPGYLVQRNVVINAFNAMKKAATDGTAASIESSFLSKPWKTFTQKVLERTIFNAFYEQHYEFHVNDLKRCSKCGISDSSSATSLRKCAGCMVPLYCSKECQKLAWVGGHRLQCELLKGTTRPDVMVYGTNYFLRKLACMDVRRHALGIKAAIADDATLQSSKPQDIVIILSYITNPPTITLMHIEAFCEITNIVSRPELMRIHGSLRSDEFLVDINSTKLGRYQEGELFIESMTLLDGVSGPQSGIDVPERYRDLVFGWARLPLQLSKGTALEFELDEIDALLIDANCRYSISGGGSEDSKPQTIFDYVEEKVRGNALR